MNNELPRTKIDEKTGIEYHLEGDYYIPNLTIPKQEKIILNKYGRMRLNYLKEHKKAEYSTMLMDGTLNSHLKEIQETATERVEQIIKQLKAKSNLTEDMKNTDMLYWVGMMNNFKNQAEEIIFNEFSEKKGEIVSGLVQKVDKNIVVLDLGKIEGIMPLKEQIPTETYHVNQKLRACVASVEKGIKGSTQIIVSRANNDFLRKLFELEIPEIYEGLIEIKSVSRDPGKRCKVAVYSPNENIDPVGSCVGQKGIRIQNIINELNGEKIDVIEWHEDPSTFIAEALLPAKVMAVDVREEEKFAQVIVPDDQLSLAIGKSGQNARLAAKLTNWKIDIKSESQFRELLQKMQEEGNEQEKVTEAQNEAKTEVEEIGNVSEAEIESTTEE